MFNFFFLQYLIRNQQIYKNEEVCQLDLGFLVNFSFRNAFVIDYIFHAMSLLIRFCQFL